MSFQPQTMIVDNPHQDVHILIQRESLVSGETAGSISGTQYYSVRPPTPTYVLPFQQVDIGVSETLIDLKPHVEAIFLERLVNFAQDRLKAISTEAEAFLRSNFNIAMGCKQVLEQIEGFLRNSDTRYAIVSDYWQDSEAPYFQALEVIVKVNISNYSKILEMWKAADKEIYKSLSPDIKDKIIVMFERL